MSASDTGASMRALLEALEYLQTLNDADRRAELERIESEDRDWARRLRCLFEQQPAATAWLESLEQTLGRGLTAELDAAWAPGRVVGPYRLERLLATGGMGAVFLARKADGELKRTVALKLVPPGLISDRSRDRVRRERDLLAALAHPNIAPLLDAGVTEDGQPWFAMEYIDGRRFDAWCGERARDRGTCVEQLRVLTEAVAYAHRNLVVHGDLKPGNVLVDCEGRLRLLDFGIARMLDEVPTEDGPCYLTARYAAPEIHGGRHPRPASDVFSLGRMLEELIDTTGGGSDRSTRELWAIAKRARAERPDDRYETAGVLADDLRRWQDGEPVAAWGGGAGYRFGKRIARHPWASAGVLAGLVLLAAFGLVSRIQAERFERERDSARQLAAFLEQVFVSADPDQSPGEPLTAHELLDRGRAGLATEQLDPAVRTRFLSILGRTYQRLGDYDSAGALLDEALESEAVFAEQRYDLAIERAETHRLVGDFAAAESDYRRILGEVPPGDVVRRARASSGLGRTLAQAGRPAEAVELLETGLALSRQQPEIAPEVLADRLNDLGSALFRLGQFETAVVRLDGALELRRMADRNAGFEHGSPRTATLVNNLALMYYLQGRPAEAEPRFREALAMRRRLLPANHPDRAQTLTNLGLMLKDYGEIDEAVTLLAEALEVRRAGLDPEHYRIGQAMLNLGIARRDAGSLESAEPLLSGALERLESALGEDHPQVAVAHNEIGRLQWLGGDSAEAEAAHRRALLIQRATLAEGHPHLAWSLLGLGHALVDAGRMDEAREALTEAVEIRRATLPEDDPLRTDAELALDRLNPPSGDGLH